ncbi:MAG: sigma-70 family RNA polymerase sigma factor [Candidatus Falkowbacteria bacterium]
MKELYLDEVKRLRGHSGLSPKETADLAKRIRSADLAARNHVIESCLLLVVQIARDNYHLLPERSCLTLDDLIQEGNLGLFKALDKYNPSTGMKFSTHAYIYIRNAIRNLIAEYVPIVHVPMNVITDNLLIKKAEQKLMSKLNRTPTINELVAETDMTADKLSGNACRMSAYYTVYLEDSVSQENEKLTFYDILPDKHSIEECLRREELDYLDYYLAKLKDRERDVLKRLFGLHGQEPEIAVDIGPQLNMSDERVRQISRGALAKLNKKIKRDELILRLKNL